ncbi:MAG: hypothetical protein KAY11_13730 [Ilumatobacteraceae bacterium]|nr:hypothetical protein [Ilumatobacteraceae bacterium]
MKADVQVVVQVVVQVGRRAGTCRAGPCVAVSERSAAATGVAEATAAEQEDDNDDNQNGGHDRWYPLTGVAKQG